MINRTKKKIEKKVAHNIHCKEITTFFFKYRKLFFALKLYRVYQGRGLVDRKHPPQPHFIAGRPKAALLFWFFLDFRCGVLLVMVIFAIFKHKNR